MDWKSQTVNKNEFKLLIINLYLQVEPHHFFATEFTYDFFIITFGDMVG